jgi:hypothetical protein
MSAFGEYTLEEIDEKIARGIASLERGEGVDCEKFLETLEAELNAEENGPTDRMR